MINKNIRATLFHDVLKLNHIDLDSLIWGGAQSITNFDMKHGLKNPQGGHALIQHGFLRKSCLYEPDNGGVWQQYIDNLQKCRDMRTLTLRVDVAGSWTPKLRDRKMFLLKELLRLPKLKKIQFYAYMDLCPWNKAAIPEYERDLRLLVEELKVDVEIAIHELPYKESRTGDWLSLPF